MEVYIIGNRKEGYYKIGVSNNPEKRLNSVQTGCPFRIELINVYEETKQWPAYRLEHELHIAFRAYNTYGEWFKFTDSEYELLKDEIAHILSTTQKKYYSSSKAYLPIILRVRSWRELLYECKEDSFKHRDGRIREKWLPS